MGKESTVQYGGVQTQKREATQKQGELTFSHPVLYLVVKIQT